ncbi:hypothetical protein FHS23_000400 [Prauserella isguenensis]|uniref:Uncharacterized protein n=1 Tax=Prauserella isguenensis TaxID=1470180 RepID=A0A839RW62_9PSEU|nr:hypothetical protein [Prauserella isguenensis]MBB3049405.1 hypothetical protein [Prauserella isguenensis]
MADVAAIEEALTTQHLEEFAPAAPPQAADVAVPSVRATARRLRREAVQGLPRWRVGERRKAKRAAKASAPDVAAAAREEALEEQRRAQAAADAEWDALLNNDSEMIMAVLEAAFEDNSSPAAPIDCRADSATVVIVIGSANVVPDQQLATTPSGEPTLRKRTKTERNSVYMNFLGSTVLATVKEAFAVAPGLYTIEVLVVRKDEDASSPDDYIAAIYAAHFHRDRVNDIPWDRVDLVHELMTADDALLRRRGQAGTVAPLGLEHEPELADVVRRIRDSLHN